MQALGDLYLIPNLLGESSIEEVLPSRVKEVISICNHFIVENEKNARRFIKLMIPQKSLNQVELFPLNKHTATEDNESYLTTC